MPSLTSQMLDSLAITTSVEKYPLSTTIGPKRFSLSSTAIRAVSRRVGHSTAHALRLARSSRLRRRATAVGPRALTVRRLKEKWLAELKAFADAVGFTGPIYGCDLGSTPALSASQIASAYVEFTRVGGKCVVQVKVWNDADASRGSVSDHVNIQYNTRKDTVENQSANTITRVNRGGVKTTYPGPLL